MSNPKQPKLTPQLEEWLEEQRLSGRQLSIEFVQNSDTTVSICLDRFTFGTFMRVAKHQNIDMRYMLSRALASTLGDVVFDKRRDGDAPATPISAPCCSVPRSIFCALSETWLQSSRTCRVKRLKRRFRRRAKLLRLAEPAEGGPSFLN